MLNTWPTKAGPAWSRLNFRPGTLTADGNPAVDLEFMFLKAGDDEDGVTGFVEDRGESG